MKISCFAIIFYWNTTKKWVSNAPKDPQFYKKFSSFSIGVKCLVRQSRIVVMNLKLRSHNIVFDHVITAIFRSTRRLKNLKIAKAIFLKNFDLIDALRIRVFLLFFQLNPRTNIEGKQKTKSRIEINFKKVNFSFF